MVWALEMTSAPPSPMSRRFDLLRRVAVTCLISKARLKVGRLPIRPLLRNTPTAFAVNSEHDPRNLESRTQLHQQRRKIKITKRPATAIQLRLWGQDTHTGRTMLAAHRDRENIYSQAPGTAKQQIPTKTPGARGQKTPFRVPLKDENANTGLGGKTFGGNGLGKSGKANAQTPAGMSHQLPKQLDRS
jgi:hypothetical protein